MADKKEKLKLHVDTREQKKLEFREGVFDVIENDCLPYGDYMASISSDKAVGGWFQIPISFERKSLADLYGTMGANYERFKKEMQRAKEANVHLILVIESNIQEVHKGYEHSQIEGPSMLKKLAMLRVRYDLEVLFFNSRREMARWIEEVFDAIARNYSKQQS